MKPVEIVHSRSRNCLEVTWPGGVQSVLRGGYLRSWCPCAVCQGHNNVVRYRPAPESTQVASLRELGAYALGIRFSDGHDTGIFTWEWLWQICAESEPTGLKIGRFEAGEYWGEVRSCLASDRVRARTHSQR